MKRLKKCIVRGLILFFAMDLASLFSQQLSQTNQVNQIKRKWLDLAYGNLGEREKLDIYLPDEGEGPFPVIIYIHGGAWMGGSKNPGAALEEINRGYAIVAVGYTLSQEAIFPRQIYEIKAAIRWVRAHAKQYHIDPNKIALWGDSAGGHLSSLGGTTGDVEELEDLSMGNPDQSSRVQAVVDWYGPTDFLKMDVQLEASGVANPMQHSVEDSPESLLLGGMITEVPERVKAVNPETYISPDDPPFFIQHGKVDNLVPYQQSQNFAAQLVRIIGKEKVTFELLEGAGHGGPAFSTPDNIKKVFGFLDKVLK